MNKSICGINCNKKDFIDNFFYFIMNNSPVLLNYTLNRESIPKLIIGIHRYIFSGLC